MRESTVVGIYARVALNENNALEKQINKLKAAAQKDGYFNFRIYSEVCSGLGETREKRGELFKLFDDTRDGVLNIVYINDVSRLSRSIIFVGEIFDRLAMHNCSIKFLEKENKKTSGNKRIFSYMRVGNVEQTS